MKTRYLITFTGLFTALVSGKVFAETDSEIGGAKQGSLTSVMEQVISDRNRLGDRLNAAHALGRHLSSESITSLYCFAAQRPSQNEQNLPGLRYLKNEVFTALRQQDTPPRDFTKTLIQIYRDHRQDSVTRDYAIQHLVLWCEQGMGGITEDKQLIRAALTEAVREGDSIAGTALLGMHRLALLDSTFRPDEINEAALAIVKSPEVSMAARITAFQVCAERRITDAIPTLETAAQTHHQTALQISAISALGRLGGPQQVLLLRRLSKYQNPMLRPVVAAALKQVEKTIAVREQY